METTTQAQTFEEAVLKTVMFWSEKAFRTAMNQNNGDDSPNGAMAFMLMNLNALKAQESVTDEKVKAFEEILAKKLNEAKEANEWYLMELDVDYHPCQMLYEAATEAGLNAAAFPVKTFTRINKEDFSVDSKYQYGGKFIKL